MSQYGKLAFVQRIGHDSSKVIMGVRFPHAGPIIIAPNKDPVNLPGSMNHQRTLYVHPPVFDH